VTVLSKSAADHVTVEDLSACCTLCEHQLRQGQCLDDTIVQFIDILAARLSCSNDFISNGIAMETDGGDVAVDADDVAMVTDSSAKKRKSIDVEMGGSTKRRKGVAKDTDEVIKGTDEVAKAVSSIVVTSDWAGRLELTELCLSLWRCIVDRMIEDDRTSFSRSDAESHARHAITTLTRTLSSEHAEELASYLLRITVGMSTYAVFVIVAFMHCKY
jgi:hypothetical protein